MVPVLSLLGLLLAGPTHEAGVGPPSCDPEVGLNHFYVVLDAETYAAVTASEPPLEGFAAADAGLPAFAPPDGKSQRLFLRGRTTYVELFRPDNRFGEPVGKVGIALGVDRPEDLDCLERLWTERLDGEAERTRVERNADEGAVPWYDAVYRPQTSLNPDLVVWAVGYLPEFLRWLYPDEASDAPRTRREDFLAPRFDPDRPLRDVVGLTVAVPSDLRADLADQFEAIGYRRWEAAGDLVLEAAGWSLTLAEAAEGRAGLLAVEFAVAQTGEEPRALPVGPRSTLTLGLDGRAVWHFEQD